MPGLLVNDQQIPIEGLSILNPGDHGWCCLEPKDHRQRPTPWVRVVAPHVLPLFGPLNPQVSAHSGAA